MTAQIAILDKKGVALVADNVARIILDDTPGMMRTALGSDRHIFQLTDSGQIALLVYGQQAFPSSRIEKLVREYGHTHGENEYEHLDDYVDAFLAFLKGKQPDSPEPEIADTIPYGPGDRYSEYEVYSSEVIPGKGDTPERILFELRKPDNEHIQAYRDAVAHVEKLEEHGGVMVRIRLMRARSALDKARRSAELFGGMQRGVLMFKPTDEADPYDVALYENLRQLQLGERALFALAVRPGQHFMDQRYSYVVDVLDVPNVERSVLRSHFPDGYGHLYGTKLLKYHRFIHQAESVFRAIANDIVGRLASNVPLSDIQKREIVADALAGYINRIGSGQRLDGMKGLEIADAQDYVRSVAGRIRRKCFVYDRHFASIGYKISSTEAALLDKIAVNLVPVDIDDALPPRPGLENYLGIAFAGFGKQDIFPSCVEVRITGLEFHEETFHQTLMGWTRRREIRITEQNAVSRLSLEASGMVGYFVQGMEAAHIAPIGQIAHPAWKEFSREFINALSERTPEEKRLPHDSDLWQQYVWGNVIQSEIRDHGYSKRASEIMDAVSGLGERELAIATESLIDLTSGWKKKPYDKAKVDRQRDVALITKAGGMQWIRRG